MSEHLLRMRPVVRAHRCSDERARTSGFGVWRLTFPCGVLLTETLLHAIAKLPTTGQLIF